MLPSEILTMAMDIIPTPEQWTQGPMAMDSQGEAVPPSHSKAVRWCAAGAICRAAQSSGTYLVREWDEASEACRQVAGMGAASFNERPGRKHHEVLAMMSKARDNLRAAGR